MTDPTTRVVAAGWYEDAADADVVRWWNGISWTDHTQPKPHRDAVSSLAAPDEASTTREAASRRVRPTSLASSVLAVSPVLFAVALIAAVALDLYVISSPAVWLVLLLPYGVCVAAAMRDAAAVRAAGRHSASGLWGLLGPLVYLIARAMRGSGWRAVVVFVGLAAVLAAIPPVLAASGLAAPVELAIRIQSEIRDDLVGSGTATAVACPPLAESMAPGTLYTCDATLADGSHRTIIVSIDSDAGDFSYSFR